MTRHWTVLHRQPLCHSITRNRLPSFTSVKASSNLSGHKFYKSASNCSRKQWQQAPKLYYVQVARTNRGQASDVQTHTKQHYKNWPEVNKGTKSFPPCHLQYQTTCSCAKFLSINAQMLKTYHIVAGAGSDCCFAPVGSGPTDLAGTV